MVLADVFKRWQTLRGRRAILSTGTDEHGMKIQQAATKAGQHPKDLCDEISEKFRDLAETMSLSEHDFIRTTEDHHVEAVQAFWKALADKGLIYETVKNGWYSVSDECFYPENMIERSFVPASGKVVFSAITSGSEVEWLEEKNYHFRMTDFKQKLLDFYKANPDWIAPQHRMKEVISWVENNLE
ncbi:class I tRNA ligase family protein, partial [Candidatus Bathyarchaeota archaeon]|nr:class I tRNA ligase family protein [Candidatus Bathyarchaeota archaeon]